MKIIKYSNNFNYYYISSLITNKSIKEISVIIGSYKG